MKRGWQALCLFSLFVFASATHTIGAESIRSGGVGAGSPTHWPIYIAIEKGMFQELGLNVEFTPISSSASVMQQVVARSLDIGVSGPVDVLRAIDQGAPLTLLRVEVGPSGYEIYARASIKSAAELRGKLVMIGGPKDITRYYMEALLLRGGLKSGDFDYIYAGATSQRYAALVAGSIDATILASPFNFTARNAGFTNLGPPPPETDRVPFVVFGLRVDWAQQHPAQVKAFLEGVRRGIEFFYEPANAEESITILQRASNAARADVEKTYAFYHDLNMFDRVGAITPDNVKAVVTLLQDQGDLPQTADGSVGRYSTPGITVENP
jgi:ABC-type nitrate/sulfonate/bicarbonate transport system substrate-binding protein